MLKLEVAIPPPRMDFDFNDARPSPFLSAPSTPKRFGNYSLSAPTSPSRMSEFYNYFNNFSMSNNGEEETSGIPFQWEEKPGTPKSPKAATNTNREDDFAFDFSAELEKASLSAEELFDGGKIRPLKPPPPRLQIEEFYSTTQQRSPVSSPRSPIEQGKKIIRDVFSPRRKKVTDPFVAAEENNQKKTENERGRESSSTRRATRSLSPCRVAEYPWEEEEKQLQQTNKQSPLIKTKTTKSSSKKWSLKDFLLFRSASEGRAYDKDPFRKYSTLFKKHEDGKNASFRSTDSSGSVSSSRRRGRTSAHELHYTMNKAASEDLKKKTFLPYKQGILGKLAFNPAVHALANGFGSRTRNQSS